jgi:FixJ family two-component response regulator
MTVVRALGATADFARDDDWSRARVVEHDVSQLRDRFVTLSPREQEVILHVTAGKMNKQVAGDLGISEITVKMAREPR